METNVGRYKYTQEDENPTEEQKQFKRAVVARIIKARENGVSAGKIAHQLGDKIHTVYDMLEAKAFPMSAWRAMDEALKELGC